MDKIRFQTLLRQAFWVPFAIGLLLAATLVVEVQFLVSRARWVDHTDQVITLAQRIYRSRIDQETGLRAFILTGDQRFMQPFLEAEQQSLALEPLLRELLSDNPEQVARNQKAVEASRAWVAWADRAIAMTKAGEDVGDTSFQLQGKELMDRYRQARIEFLDSEQLLRDQRLASSRYTLDFVNASVVVLCVLFGVGFAALGRRQLQSLSQNFNQALNASEAHAADAQAQKERFQTTLHSIGDAVIATDAEGIITLMNPVAENLTRWGEAEARGKPLAEVFRIVNEQTRETVENPIEKVRRLNSVVGLANHTILISKSGEEFAIDDSGAPIRDSNGAIAGVVLVFRDVTRQRALEAAIQSNERLALAGRLSASIAHEIHNPLDTVGNVLFLLSEQVDGRPETQQLIATAQAEVHRVAEISKNMLSLHRESRAATPVKLSELLEGVVTLIQETVAKGGRNIRLEHGFQGEVEGFAFELRQVFTNVIKNAVEATTAGGNIRVVSQPAQDAGCAGALVHVIDDGSGIPEHMRSKLFSPFASSKEESGTGLGLWVSRSIVEKHGGTIRVTSGAPAQDPGTKVSIFLPLEVRSRENLADSMSA